MIYLLTLAMSGADLNRKPRELSQNLDRFPQWRLRRKSVRLDLMERDVVLDGVMEVADRSDWELLGADIRVDRVLLVVRTRRPLSTVVTQGKGYVVLCLADLVGIEKSQRYWGDEVRRRKLPHPRALSAALVALKQNGGDDFGCFLQDRLIGLIERRRPSRRPIPRRIARFPFGPRVNPENPST